ncbi:hypothetical protein [Pigmentiphaga daeguensis]|uniref:Uncharacterized protein n=1 Tax=Pigmentiphaga daeguensis TaxID=414049 RepID=A0ABN1BA57_9BURK
MREIVLLPGEEIHLAGAVVRAAAQLPSAPSSPTALRDFLNSMPVHEQEDFAARCGKSLGYLRLVAYGHRRCRESLAINIDRESGSTVRLQDLRPDVDWRHVQSVKLEAADA